MKARISRNLSIKSLLDSRFFNNKIHGRHSELIQDFCAACVDKANASKLLAIDRTAGPDSGAT